jgi:hypothetical protein
VNLTLFSTQVHVHQPWPSLLVSVNIVQGSQPFRRQEGDCTAATSQRGAAPTLRFIITASQTNEPSVAWDERGKEGRGLGAAPGPSDRRRTATVECPSAHSVSRLFEPLVLIRPGWIKDTSSSPPNTPRYGTASSPRHRRKKAWTSEGRCRRQLRAE